ncbi:pyrin and HIN domain-containing protein 1-like [Octodon degus]|uniref:Pyrin and HIN domain-containing protein 1-like n=1 Tax=Octodon degus TaxID=10160 RepID=A0A6P6D7F5_OCTDE|nr:pyrin and HIN domain-containing protein 1-like [Octodon degus]
MENKFKRIVLLKGLYPISDFHFRTVKSLMAKDLNLKGTKHEEYDKVKFADLMAEKFKSDAGLGKLITIFKDIPDLEGTADILRKEKAKVSDKKKCKRKPKTTEKSNKKKKSSTVQHALTTPQDSQSESVTNLPSSKDTSEISMQESDGPTQPKKKKENPTKKADNLKKTKPQQETSLMPETPASTTALQSPVKPAPNYSSSTSAQKKKNTVSKTNKSITIDTDLETTNTLPDRSCPQTLLKPSVSSLSSLLTPQVWPTPPHSQQSTQMPSTTLKTPQQTPQIPASTSSRSLQMSQTPSVTPSGNLSTPERAATLPNQVQIVLMSPEISSKRQTPQMPLAAPRNLNTAQKPTKISFTSLKIPQSTPKCKPSNTQTLPKATKTQTSRLQTTQVPPEISTCLPTLHMPLPPSSSMQTPQKAPKTLPRNLQTIQILPAPASSLQTPGMLPEAISISYSTMKPRLKCVPSEPSEETGYQPNCKEVMVLRVTEPFIYNFKEPENMMLHATVATENEFFRVKVFDMAVKDMFIPKNVLSISHYHGRDGFLEIYKYSAVSNVSADRSLNISSTLVQRANATPKISQICLPCKSKYVNGTFTVCKKTVKGEFMYYDIEDNTGKMEVVVHGWLRNNYCEVGDKLNLTCFEVASSGGSCQLRSVLHSHLKVNKTRKAKM